MIDRDSEKLVGDGQALVPTRSDLRGGGCLTGDTRLLRADTGAEITLDAQLV